MTQNNTWQRGVVVHPEDNMKIYENDQLKILRNVVRIDRDRQAISDQGDSGSLVFSAEDPADCLYGADADQGLLVYGMTVGKVELQDGTSFTVANRLCCVLPAIHHDQKNSELFRGYKELNLCGIMCVEEEPDSGFRSTSTPP